MLWLYCWFVQGVEAVTVAVLIGIAASKFGSADPFTSKTLCLHIPSLLPPLRCDIDISPTVQAAALTGLGMLYATSANRLMTEFLLAELLKTPSTDKYDNRCNIQVLCIYGDVLGYDGFCAEKRCHWLRLGPWAWY
jgi:hypothetical protein